MWDAFLLFLEEYGAELGAGAAGLAIIETIFAPFRRLFKRADKVELGDQSQEVLKQIAPKSGQMDVTDFIRIRRELKAELETELAQADDAEKTQLRARIAELESQIANPDEALEEANRRIKDLEALLDRSGNDIGGDRIAEAKAALEEGDYSIADDIFAEIEAKNQLAVEEAARAAYGRGEVAEEEVRWADAADHYERSAQLAPSYDALRKASEFCERSGQYQKAIHFSSALVGWAKENESKERYAHALNEHAISYRSQGRYEEAEGIFREALEIDRATIGEGHPSYANGLNNLASVVGAQGRHEQAESLLRQALEIDRATIGDRHPDFAISLNNLAGTVRDQGRYEEAEGLYRQALEIDRATLGERHPDYAVRLNNLSLVVEDQGQYEEAEGLYRQALEIDRAALGDGHPTYAIRLLNLASNLATQCRSEEARPMLEQALTIFRATLPEDHPHIATTLRHIDALPGPGREGANE